MLLVHTTKFIGKSFQQIEDYNIDFIEITKIRASLMKIGYEWSSSRFPDISNTQRLFGENICSIDNGLINQSKSNDSTFIGPFDGNSYDFVSLITNLMIKETNKRKNKKTSKIYCVLNV